MHPIGKQLRKETNVTQVLTFIVDTAQETINAAMTAAVDVIHKAGDTVREIRIMDDSGEVKVDPVAVATVPAPGTVPVEEPEATPEPVEPVSETPEVPVDTPPNPTEVSATDTPTSDTPTTTA
jgi:hypothetical protein